jgi:hypothetical protein
VNSYKVDCRFEIPYPNRPGKFKIGSQNMAVGINEAGAQPSQSQQWRGLGQRGTEKDPRRT